MRMPFDYSIDTEAGVTYVAVRGELLIPDYRELLTSVALDPAFDPTYPWVFDLAEAEIPSTDFIRRVARIDEDNKQMFAGRQAIVARADVTYGMVRMYQQVSDELQEATRVCRSLEEAREWLGLPGDWEPPGGG